MKRIKLLIALLMMLMAVNSQAAIKAFLNQTTVYDGDTVQLTIESDRKISDQPDLSVLKKDFIIQSKSQGTNFSMVNGNSSFSQNWKITLMPKGKGELIIPVITVGSETTTPIKLTVTDVTPEVQQQNREHVTLEATAEIGKTLPYVQQQIRYTLKLYTDDTVREGDIYPPEIENAVIEQISGDKQYGVSRNGKRLDVLERHYVISPEKSGKLVIPPAIFKGKQLVEGKRSRRGGVFDDVFDDPFFSSPFGSSGKPITTRSDSIEIAVQTIPSEFKGEHWLPAEDLVIIDSWKKKLPIFHVGEPVERMLVVQAKGLAGSQVPEFFVAKPENMKVYPEQERALTKSDGKTIFGIRKQGMSYIPSKEGKVIIPAITIDWWNTQTGKQESFVLEERVIEVVAGAADNKQLEAMNANGEASDNESISQSAKDTSNVSSGMSLNDYVLWIFVVIILASLVGYLGNLVFKKWKLFSQKRKVHSAPLKISSRQLMNQLQQACQNNDNRAAAKVLLMLADNVWAREPPTNLGALARVVESGADEIRTLDKSLYANVTQGWQGAQLWNALGSGIKPKGKNKAVEQDILSASLYPERV